MKLNTMVLCSAVALLMAGPVLAEPTTGTIGLQVRANGVNVVDPVNESISAVGDSFSGSGHINYEDTFEDLYTQFTGAVNIQGGTPALATAQGEATINLTPSEEAGRTGSYAISGRGHIIFAVNVVPTAANPAGYFGLIPVTAAVNLEASAFGSDDLHSHAVASFNYVGVGNQVIAQLAADSLVDGEPDPLITTEHLMLSVDDPNYFSKTASFEISTNGALPGNHQASATATTDPIFAFDQAAFDLMMGSETFDLASYYGLEFSDGFVPEPTSLAMLGVGGLVLFRRRR